MNTSLNPVRQLAFWILLAVAMASANAVEPTATIGVKGRANSYASLAASGRFAALVWGARTSTDVTDIFLATSTDGGRAFSAPTRVNAAAGDASLAGEQPRRIVLIPREKGSPSIVVVWTSRTAAGTRLVLGALR